jgi:hypothetical protein
MCARLRLCTQQSDRLFLSKHFLARTTNSPHITQIIRYTKKTSILGYGAMQSDKYQGFGGTFRIHLHSGRPENACSKFLRNTTASPTHCCLSTTTHVAVEWYSRYSVQILAQKTAVIAEIPVGFRTRFKNMLGTYVKLRHDRYVHVL